MADLIKSIDKKIAKLRSELASYDEKMAQLRRLEEVRAQMDEIQALVGIGTRRKRGASEDAGGGTEGGNPARSTAKKGTGKHGRPKKGAESAAE
jgi:hypothetical protein